MPGECRQCRRLCSESRSRAGGGAGRAALSRRCRRAVSRRNDTDSEVNFVNKWERDVLSVRQFPPLVV